MKRGKKDIVFVRKIYRHMAVVFSCSFLLLAMIIIWLYYGQHKRSVQDYATSAVRGISTLMTESEKTILGYLTDEYEAYYRQQKGLAWIIRNMEHGTLSYRTALYASLAEFFSRDIGVESVSLYLEEDEAVHLVTKPVTNTYGTDVSLYDDLKEAQDYPRFRLKAVRREADKALHFDAGIGFTYCVKDIATYQNIGAIGISYDEEELRRVFKDRYPRSIGSYFVVDEEGEVLLSFNETETAVSFAGAERIGEAPHYIFVDGKAYLALEESLDNPSLYVICLIPAAEMMRGAVLSMIAAVAVIAAAIFLSYGIISRYLKKNTQQLSHIHEALRMTAKGDLEHMIPIESGQKDELTEVSEAYNRMLLDLNAHIEKDYRMEIANKQYQLKLLQSQIHPHFLYNALESIRMKAYMEGRKDIGEMAFILSKVLRNSVKGEGMVSIRQETLYCRDYLKLCEYQYTGLFTCEMDIDPDINGKQIIQHSLLTLIENFFVHGLDSGRQDNILRITGRLQGETILFTVTDNGVGIDEERMQALQRSFENDYLEESGSLGLKNLYHRMALEYRDSFTFEVNAKEGDGTRITFSYPAKDA